MLRIGYYTAWSVYDEQRRPIRDLVRELELTHVVYAFAMCKEESGEFCLHDSNAAYDRGALSELKALKSEFPDIQLGISIGGWNHRHLLAKLTGPKLECFAIGLATFTQQHGFDFVDLDWEFEDWQAAKALEAALHHLVGCLKDSLARIYLTMALQANPEICQHLGLDRLSPSIRWFMLMGYNFSGSWSSSAAPHSNLYPPTAIPNASSIAGVVDRIKSCIPLNRIVLGLSGCGIEFQYCHDMWKPFQGAKDIAMAAVALEYRHFWDQETCSSYYKGNDVIISIETKKSVEAKTQFVESHNMAGLAIWDIEIFSHIQ